MEATKIVKKALVPRLEAGIDRLCRSGKFSLTTDESNDQGGEKALVILARLFDRRLERAMPTLSGSSRCFTRLTLTLVPS